MREKLPSGGGLVDKLIKLEFDRGCLNVYAGSAARMIDLHYCIIGLREAHHFCSILLAGH